MYSPSRPAPSPMGTPYLPPSHPFAASWTGEPIQSEPASSIPPRSPPPPRRPGYAKYPSSPAALATSPSTRQIASPSIQSSAVSACSQLDSDFPVTPSSFQFSRVLEYRVPESPLSRTDFAPYDDRSLGSTRYASSAYTPSTSQRSKARAASHSPSPPPSIASRQSSTSQSASAAKLSTMPNELSALDHRPRQNLLSDLEFIVGKRLRFPALGRLGAGTRRRTSEDMTGGEKQARSRPWLRMRRQSEDKRASLDEKLEAERWNNEEQEDRRPLAWTPPPSIGERRPSGRGVREGNWI